MAFDLKSIENRIEADVSGVVSKLEEAAHSLTTPFMWRLLRRSLR